MAATVSAPEAIRLRAAILRNVEDSINTIVDGSTVLKHLGETGTLSIVGAYYEQSTGRVYFSEPAAIALQMSADAAEGK